MCIRDSLHLPGVCARQLAGIAYTHHIARIQLFLRAAHPAVYRKHAPVIQMQHKAAVLLHALYNALKLAHRRKAHIAHTVYKGLRFPAFPVSYTHQARTAWARAI